MRPDDPEKGLRRTLEVLLESLVLDESRRSELRARVQRMTLSKRMIDRLGLSDPPAPLVQAILSAIESSCIACATSLECRRWLDSEATDGAYRAFCSNAALFEMLVGEGNSVRPSEDTTALDTRRHRLRAAT
jgi:hypothetical protein